MTLICSTTFGANTVVITDKSNQSQYSSAGMWEREAVKIWIRWQTITIVMALKIFNPV